MQSVCAKLNRAYSWSTFKLDDCALAVAQKARSLETSHYAAHYRSEHQYSPFHQKLDAALKYFYNKRHLAIVLLKKGWIEFKHLYLLDRAIVDVWANVVWVKIPKWIPSKKGIMFEQAQKYLCRFISKKDFLQAAIDYAMIQGNGAIARCCKSNPTKMLVESSTGAGVYQLTLTKYAIKCDCQAYLGLSRAHTEECYLRGLMNQHPILQGQLPDLHVFSVWASWGVKDFRHYQYEYGRRSLQHLGLLLDFIIPGRFIVYYHSRKLGSVDFKVDRFGREFWINQRQLTMLQRVPGDEMKYETAQEAAIGLAKFLKVMDDDQMAKAALFSAP